MTASLRVRLDGLEMPNLCVACGAPATRRYDLLRTFTYGKRSHSITLPAPMCDKHHAHAAHRSRAERRCQQVGLVAGAIAGLATAAALATYWASNGSGLSALNLMLAAFVGLGGFLIVWVGVLLWVAPRFADPASKAARSAVTLY